MATSTSCSLTTRHDLHANHRAQRTDETKPIAFCNSFPRSPWECRLGRSASARPVTQTTQSVGDCIPTEDRGNEYLLAFARRFPQTKPITPRVALTKRSQWYFGESGYGVSINGEPTVSPRTKPLGEWFSAQGATARSPNEATWRMVLRAGSNGPVPERSQFRLRKPWFSDVHRQPMRRSPRTKPTRGRSTRQAWSSSL
jgi:hypothetical protein